MNVRPAKLYKKEALAQMVPCEICEVFKKTYFEENLPMTAPEEAFKKPWTYEGSRESYWSVLEFF